MKAAKRDSWSIYSQSKDGCMSDRSIIPLDRVIMIRYGMAPEPFEGPPAALVRDYNQFAIDF